MTLQKLRTKHSTIINQVEIYYPSHFDDERGTIYSLCNQEYPVKFVEDKVTISHRNSFRGFHGDFVTWKLITCLQGYIYLSLIDLNKGSTYLHQIGLTLLGDYPKTILIPPGVLNAHYAMEKSVFFYKWSHEYTSPQDQISVNYKSKGISCVPKDINPVLSDRDKNSKTLNEVLNELYE